MNIFLFPTLRLPARPVPSWKSSPRIGWGKCWHSQKSSYTVVPETVVALSRFPFPALLSDLFLRILLISTRLKIYKERIFFSLFAFLATLHIISLLFCCSLRPVRRYFYVYQLLATKLLIRSKKKILIQKRKTFYPDLLDTVQIRYIKR